jgi:hypothetical protein
MHLRSREGIAPNMLGPLGINDPLVASMKETREASRHVVNKQ